jgi:hypothetical protein
MYLFMEPGTDADIYVHSTLTLINILLWDIQETAMDWQISNSNLVL